VPEKESSDLPKARPFVKWAGGKGQLLDELLKRIPESYTRYFEPFVGGGALFFKLQPIESVIADINPDLMNAFEVVKKDVDGLVEDLSQHRYEREYYYQIRDIDRSEEYNNWTAVQKASRLIYLNKTCFNGLYRVNSKGFFNTPFGSYSNPKICDEVNLRACSQALKNARIELASFEVFEDELSEGDFVYLDPPYAPLSQTSSFTAYSKGGFVDEDQERLRDFCLRLNEKGVKFLLSNSLNPLIQELYKGFRVEIVSAVRAINSQADKRGQIQELIIRNYLS